MKTTSTPETPNKQGHEKAIKLMHENMVTFTSNQNREIKPVKRYFIVLLKYFKD